MDLKHGINPGLKLLTGKHAVACAKEAAFQSQWMTLYAACPWATACQHPQFVVAWYDHYQADYLPVMVIGESDDGKLVGLLTLALRARSATMSGAGDQQAEYQGWMHVPNAGDGFIGEAIGILRAAFPSTDLCLKYLPPGIPLRAFEIQERYAGLVSLRRHRRPLMKIEPSAMQRQRSKKNHRQNYNRLGRIGTVSFEKIVGHDRFVDAFDEICLQYDFRQGALHRSMPFSDDASKRPFYVQLHKSGLLHATLLRVGMTIAATHIGLLSPGRAVHLGINTHAPALAAHSPGTLLLAMLGVHLASEDIPWLDLTPGGDGYKEHFATDHDEVFELTVYGDKRRRWRREAILAGTRLLKNGLRKAGYRPSDAMAAIRRMRNPGIPAVLHRHRARSRELTHCASCQAAPARRLPIAKNNAHHVIRFDAQGSSTGYREFLSVAMRRMERSNDLYSLVLDDILAICCWVQIKRHAAPSRRSTEDEESGSCTILLSDLYVHRKMDKDELVKAFLMQVICDLYSTHAAACLRYQGHVDRRLRTWMGDCGFFEDAR